jgi:hypothetical protein
MRIGPITLKLSLPKHADFLADFLLSVARAAHEKFLNKSPDTRVVVFEDDKFSAVRAEHRKVHTFR